MKPLIWLIGIFWLTACGYKGDLYLPHEDDPNRFGVIQTGWEWQSQPTERPSQPPFNPYSSEISHD